MLEKNLNEIIYEKIKQMLLDYDLIAGQKVVVADLAEKLGVSRTPVNNALFLLAKQGFLDVAAKQGYKVHQLTRQESDALYEMREVLELGSIEKAIASLTEEKLEILAQREEDFKKAVTDGLGRSRYLIDQEFHACIVEISGNPYMAHYYREVYQKIFLRHRISPLRGERTIQVPKEHHEIYEAIRLRDVPRAQKAISAHIQAGKDYIHSFIF